uniref:Heme NO-binding domain-containing protein n=1 Tax=Timema cristinae TaxID=61476 RepID=A0A7R9CXN2_TIMCR|nr:unnamed protein product [Timema cristinae]
MRRVGPAMYLFPKRDVMTTMYGLLLENMSEFIKQVYGEDKWEEIRRMAQVDQPSFSVHQVYPENLIPRLAKKAIQSVQHLGSVNSVSLYRANGSELDFWNDRKMYHCALITDIPRTSSRNTAHRPSSTRKQELSHRVACDPCALVRYPPSSRRCAGAKLGKKSEKCYHVCLLTPSWLTLRRCAQAPSLGKEREVLSRVSSYPLMVNLMTLRQAWGKEREVLSRVSSYPLMVNLTTLCAGAKLGERARSAITCVFMVNLTTLCAGVGERAISDLL